MPVCIRIVAVLAIVACAHPAFASIAIFSIHNPAYEPPALDPGTEGYPEGRPVDQEYGDRINSLTQISGDNTFTYEVGPEGFTPNVVMAYGPGSIFTGGPELWRYDYGDLDRVLYQASHEVFVTDPDTGELVLDGNGNPIPLGTNYNYLEINLFADPGYEVVLYGFDLGGWNRTDRPINEVAVYDAQFNGFFPDANKIYSDPLPTVEGTDGHSTYDFSANPLRGNIITIFLDMNNLGDDDRYVGIDNIRFGQDLARPTDTVPEATTLASWSVLALLGAVSMRRRIR